jgi:hypothetical protein
LIFTKEADMSRAFVLLLLPALLSACLPLSEADIQATGTAARKAEAIKTNEAIHETVVAKTDAAEVTRIARRTQAASLPPLEKLEQVCKGQPVPEAAAYDRGAAVHPVYITGHSQWSYRFNDNLPRGSKPELISDVQLVVCFEERDEVLEVCKYGLASGFTQVRITRHRTTLIATLYEASAARLVDTHSFQKNAIACPGSTNFKNDNDFYPPEFEYSEILGWLERFISQ